VNEIALVIAPAEFGVGVCDGLEPIIDGVSLVDVMKRVDGEIVRDPGAALARSRREHAPRRSVQAGRP
jgi:hypothetical protein